MAALPLHTGRLAAKAAAVTCVLSAGLSMGLPPALSAVIENKDTGPYTITVEQKDGRSTHQIAAGGKLEGFCLDGCIVILDGISDGAYRLPEGNEIVSIEQGVLFYEGAIVEKAEQP